MKKLNAVLKFFSFLSFLLISCVGCAKEKPPEESTTKAKTLSATPGNLKKGKQLYEIACASCHGIEGKGDGPASRGLTPPPRNFTERAYMEKRSDEQLFKTIKEGGAATGKSPLMPPHPHFSDQDIKDIIAYVRTFAKEY